MSSEKTRLASRVGRPSLARVEAIDRAIVQAARRLFLADGFDGVTMVQIAVGAKISRGTLYARYDSKEALFKDVIDATIKHWSDEASISDHLMTNDIGQRLLHHATILSTWLQRADVIAFQKVIRGVQDRFPGLAVRLYDVGTRYLIDLIAQDITDASKRDGMVVHRPSHVADMLVSAIFGHHAQNELTGVTSCEDYSLFVESTVNLVIAARPAW